MTGQEFTDWFEDFCETFPDVGIWLAGQPNCGGVLAKWAERLASADPRDCYAVTVAMSDFRLESIGTTDHERGGTGRRIAREASTFARERLQRDRIAEAVSHGDDVERTYRCSCCRDSGLVTVVNPVAWNSRRLILDDMAVRCTCDAAKRYAKDRSGVKGEKFGPLQQYNRGRHFRAMDGITEDVRRGFREWHQDACREALAYDEHQRLSVWDPDSKIQQEAF